MTKERIPKLVITLGIPTTISMLITNIYNMADTYFVSQISLSASGATGIVFSVMCILQAFGFMFGHGAGSNVSRSLGAKNKERASMFASTSFMLALLTGSLIGIFGLVFIEPLMLLLGSTETILPEAIKYARFIFISGPAMTLGCVLNNILRYEGRATYAMFGLTAGGILNMFMDPILIFGLKLGTTGAGLSTAISQYISLLILLYPYLKGISSSELSIKNVSKDFKDYKNIIYTGSPSLFRQSLNSITSATLNIVAKPFGDGAIAAMSIVGRCSNLIFSTALGVAQGFQPVAAFNYGSRDYKRVKEAASFTMLFGTILMVVIGTVVYLNAPLIVSMFRKDIDVISIGSMALRYICLSIVLLPFSSISNMLFQSVGKSGRALFLAITQSGLFHIPLLLILPRILGVKGIALATPIAYILAAIVALPFTLSFFKELKYKN